MSDFEDAIARFNEFGTKTQRIDIQTFDFNNKDVSIPGYINEFWTAKQRAANSLHEISYRACFKPQLPRFFIERLTEPGAKVYDPFMGRGTTLLEAALLGRVPVGCDVNPLSQVLVRPRLTPPSLAQVEERLQQIPFDQPSDCPEDLLVFYHPETLSRIGALRQYLLERKAEGRLDAVDDWICLLALNRLTGHSVGFFSVYTLPPNQAVSVKSQQRINERRKQTPPLKDVAAIILKKSRHLLSDCSPDLRKQLTKLYPKSILLTRTADDTPEIRSGTIDLVVTSPPFLNVVDYATDNWLRCWFLGMDAKEVKLTQATKLDAWQKSMTLVFKELKRVLKTGGHVAFEVGEVDKGAVKLEEFVIPCALAVGLEPRLVLINQQTFTKTANCWGVDNNAKGTNSNRVVLLRKPKKA